jgi:organic radical activating enzyme
LLAGAFGHHPNHSRVIRRVDPVGRIEEVVTLSTSAGSFIAGGYVVKNCDTKYTWDWERYDRKTEVVELEVERVVERARVLAASGVRNIVLTGGEPLLQQVELGRLAGELRRDGFRLEVETNGTIQPSAAVAEAIDQWNVSPKLETSDNPLRARRRAAPLSWFAAQPNAWFKFVVTSDADLVEIDELVTSLSVPSTQVILMPEGTDASSQLAGGRWLADACRERGYRLGSRLHVLLWGADRGR